MKVVLDTNTLTQVVFTNKHPKLIWDAFINEEYTLCVSNEIIMEYEEILNQLVPPEITDLVITTILSAENTEKVSPDFRFNLIHSDYDDNKFVDCAIYAKATYIVTEDTHFNELKQNPYPIVNIKNIQEFLEILKK